MNLKVYLVYKADSSGIVVNGISYFIAYKSSISNDLSSMADAAGVYRHIWRPEGLGIIKASELVAPLNEGLRVLRANKERFKCFEPKHKRDTYEDLTNFIEHYIKASIKYPDATIEIER